jgi:hypothetical protein
MLLTSDTTVLGVFDGPAQAAKAIAELKKAGFTDNDIGVASKEWSKNFDKLDPGEQHVAEHGAIGGGLIGGGLGAALGLVGAIAVPAAIPIFAGSALASMLVGAAAGAAGGVFVGPFIAMGFSEEEAGEHVKHIERGKTVLIVYSPKRRDEARKIMVEQGAYDESMSNSP